MGKWTAGQRLTTDEIAPLIFASGISTKLNVTDISGRAVGLDAAKHYLQSCGGHIRFKLADNTDSDSEYLAFETIVSLPAQLVCDTDNKLLSNNATVNGVFCVRCNPNLRRLARWASKSSRR